MNLSRRALLCRSPALVAALAFCVTAAATGCAGARSYATSQSIYGAVASLELYDRSTGTVLNVYTKDQDRFVIGNPGAEYRLRLRNLSGARILAVASVDGVNIISGETAAPDQSGYVLEPYGVVDVDGWRKSQDQTNAFFFTDLGNSYAARTGRPNNVGIIGVAVFQERVRIAQQPMQTYADKVAKAEAYPASPTDTPMARGDGALRDQLAANAPAEMQNKDRAAGTVQALRPAPSLGTGYGRVEDSSVRRVDFVRASSAPTDLLTLRYDRRDNLVAMGVIAAPRVVGRAPDAFPGMRYVPEPR